MKLCDFMIMQPENTAYFEAHELRFGLANAAPAVDFDKLGQDYEAACLRFFSSQRRPN